MVATETLDFTRKKTKATKATTILNKYTYINIYRKDSSNSNKEKMILKFVEKFGSFGSHSCKGDYHAGKNRGN